VAVEMGMRNHEFVPVYLVEKIAHMKRANAFKILKNLLKYKLVEHTGLHCNLRLTFR
jgi:RIO kinase 2